LRKTDGMLRRYHSLLGRILRSTRGAFVVSLLAVTTTTCSHPTDAPAPSPPAPPAPVPRAASLELIGPSSLIVNQALQLTVIAKDASGQSIRPGSATFRSHDPTIVEVTGEGVVLGRRRGATTVDVSLDGLSASVQVAVSARLRLHYAVSMGYASDAVFLAVGDSVRLKAVFVDVNGNELGDQPAAAWRSDNPSGVSVDSDGLLVGRQLNAVATVHVETPESVTSTRINVNVPSTGPARVRFAHAAKGLGAVTFFPTKGRSETLRFGESVEMDVAPGNLQVTTAGVPAIPLYGDQSRIGVTARSENAVTFVVIGGSERATVRTLATSRAIVAADSIRLTLLQGLVGYPVVYVAPRGQLASGLPLECYFDPMHFTRFRVAAKPFDLILFNKYPGAWEAARLSVDVAGGRGYTLVFVGDPLEFDVSYAAFVDP
jgi:hypothetical protein